MKYLSLIGILVMTISCTQDKQSSKTEHENVLEYQAGIA